MLQKIQQVLHNRLVSYNTKIKSREIEEKENITNITDDIKSMLILFLRNPVMM